MKKKRERGDSERERAREREREIAKWGRESERKGEREREREREREERYIGTVFISYNTPTWTHFQIRKDVLHQNYACFFPFVFTFGRSPSDV